MINYEDFIKANLGKPVEREDPTNVDQCFDWAFAYLDDVLGISRSAIRHLRAYEIWTLATDETRKYFDLVANTPTGTPPKGALVIFGTAVGVSGHVCIATGSNEGITRFQSTDQNWNGHSYIEYVWHNYTGVLGWLVPKSLPPSTTEPLATITQKELDQIRKDRDLHYNELQATKKTVDSLNQILADKNGQIASLQTTNKQLKDESANQQERLNNLIELSKKVPQLETLLNQAESDRAAYLAENATLRKQLAQYKKPQTLSEKLKYLFS